MLAEREEQFWDRWYAENYSWEGLKAKRLDDSRTLQDFWGAEKERGLLVMAPDGREYTRFHLPFVLRSGEATSKNAMTLAEQKALGETINQMASDAGKSDGVLALDGVVLPDAIEIDGEKTTFDLPLDVRMHQAWVRKLTLKKCKLKAFLSDRAYFPGGINLDEIDVAERLTLWMSAFGDRSWMRKVSAHAPVQIGETYFQDWLSIRDCKFNKAFWSWRAYYARDFRCSDSVFGGTSIDESDTPCVTFGAAHFSALAEMTDCTFLGKTTFQSAVFEQDAVFNGVKWPACHDEFEEAFAGATLSGNAYFHEDSFSAFAAFAGANFEREVLLGEEAIMRDGRFRAALAQAMSDDDCLKSYRQMIAKEQEERGIDGKGREQARLSTFRENARTAMLRGDAPTPGRLFYAPTQRELEKPRAKPSAEFEEVFFEPRLRSLEAGLRAVRKGAAEVRNISMAQRFFRFELLTRRKRTQRLRGGVGILFSAYRRLSDFGSSFSRPVIGLVVLWMFAALFYLGTGVVFVNDISATGDVPGALEFSARNIFRPTSVWSARDFHGQETFSFKLLFQSSDIVRLIVRGVASFQSLVSGILVFLFALAARRQFELR